jgi:hypothetical protein
MRVDAKPSWDDDAEDSDETATFKPRKHAHGAF